MSEQVTLHTAHPQKKQNKRRLSKKQKKILLIASGSTGALLLLVYFGLAIYFNSHFYFGTQINGINCNGMTVKEANKAVQQYVDTYTLTIEKRNSQAEQLYSKEFDLQSKVTSDVSVFKDKQNGFGWPAALFHDYKYSVDTKTTYDKDKLNKLIDNLSCMQDNNMKEPENATIELSGSTYKIISEKNGTKLDKDKVRECITAAIDNVEPSVNLEEQECYITPTYTSESEAVVQACKKLNTYSNSKVTYTILGNTEVITGKQIRSWLSWNESFEINIDSSKASEIVSSWGDAYNTSGKPHTLNTSYGTTVTIDKGNYGWKIDVDSTTAELIQAIKDGETSKEPVYSKKAISQDAARDYGNTYVEINLGTQHLFFYKDGALVVESDFVSGKVTNGNATPTGIYGLTYKQSPAVLRGPGYASPVKYWMPFNGGVGMHDASWRKGKFGGNIFYNNGSHGCINLPTAAAKTIYENIPSGCPIIVYDEKIEEAPLEEITLTQEEINAAASEQDENSAANAGITDITPDVSVDVSGDVSGDVSIDNSGNSSTVVIPAPTQTPVPTQTPTPTTKPTETQTPSPTEKPTVTPTQTPTATPTQASTPTPSPSSSPAPTESVLPTPSTSME